MPSGFGDRLVIIASSENSFYNPSQFELSHYKYLLVIEHDPYVKVIKNGMLHKAFNAVISFSFFLLKKVLLSNEKSFA